MNYRTLRLGEVLQDGDEFWSAFGDWQKTNSVGGKVDAMDFAGDMRYRRPLPEKPIVKVKKPVNFQRLALRMSKAKSITEVRAIYKKAVGK